MKLPRTFAQVFIAAVLFIAAATLLATVIPLPPKPADVVGVWFGYAEDQISFLRLELDADGTGYLCVKYLPDTPPRLYHVESWRLSGSMVDIQTRPIDSDAEAVTFKKVRLSMYSLEGKFGGKGWERQVTLFSEHAWQSQATPVQERITHYRKDRQ
jgi:hypothetical protein